MKDLSRCTILVVDDIEVNIDILVEVLGADYEVAVAMDGETALEAVIVDPPDLILLDIVMPGMSGFEVCERLKADESTRDIGIIFLTGKTEPVDREKAMELGAVDFINKPVNIPELKEKVRNYLLQAK